MALSWPAPKDPNEVLPYTLDWTPRLGEVSVINASWWELPLDNPDTALVLSASSFTTNTSTIWLAGGTNGVRYEVVCFAQTDTGWTMVQSVRLTVKER